MYVCICMAVTDSEVRAARRDGACTLDELKGEAALRAHDASTLALVEHCLRLRSSAGAG